MKKSMKRTIAVLLCLLLCAGIGVPVLAGPVEGFPEKGDTRPFQDGAYPYATLPRAKEQQTLPKHIYFRTNTQDYNRKYEVALRDGVLYMRKRNSGDKWREAPCPESLKGKIKSISMDSIEIVALDEEQWIYTCFNCNSDTTRWTWGTDFGGVGRSQGAFRLGNAAPGQWSLSVTDPEDDGTYTDIDGVKTPVSLAGCTQLVFVDPDDPTKVISNDPWLAQDHSYTFGSPMHGRFKVQALSASASTVFVINKYGDMYTRLHDYDLSGGDPAQFKYSWYPQAGKEQASNYAEARFDRDAAAIRLPAPGWEKQPKIPGQITDRISIESTAPGSENRRLKVEGKYNGRTGYFTKMLKEDSWGFVPTDLPLQGEKLRNTVEDTADQDLAPETGIDFKGTLWDGSTLTVRDFAYDDSVQYTDLQVGDLTIHPTLYTEYGNLGRAITQILTSQPQGLTEESERSYVAALTISEQERIELVKTPEGRKFLMTVMLGQRIRPMAIKVSSNKMVLAPTTDRNTPLTRFKVSLDRVAMETAGSDNVK